MTRVAGRVSWGQRQRSLSSRGKYLICPVAWLRGSKTGGPKKKKKREREKQNVRYFSPTRHEFSIQVQTLLGRDAREDIRRRRGQTHILPDAGDVVGAVLHHLGVLRHGRELLALGRLVDLGHEFLVHARRGQDLDDQGLELGACGIGSCGVVLTVR